MKVEVKMKTGIAAPYAVIYANEMSKEVQDAVAALTDRHKMKKIIGKTLMGIAWGCTILAVVLLIGCIADQGFLARVSSGDMVRNVVCSMVAGIAFTLPALAYENDRLPRGMQVLIHMGIGFAVYFPVTFYAKWIPVSSAAATVITIGLIVAGSVAIWFCFSLYYKKEAKKITRRIRETQNK